MAGFYGADVADLRNLAHALEKSAQSLHQITSGLSGAITSTRWPGPDGAQFTGEWTQMHRSALARAGECLSTAAETLRRNAGAQEATSAADGGVLNPVGGGSGGGDGDRPDDPELTDGLGDYEDLDDPIPFTDDALDPSEISQGQLGDCWLLAALGSVAGFDPDFIRDHMWENPDGTWTVKMYDDDGKPVYIQVEPSVPQNGVNDADGNPSWATIYEKAAAEYFGGSYDDLDGGWSDRAFEAITGQPAHDLGEASFDTISDALEDGPVALSSEAKDKKLWFFGDTVDDTDRVVPHHAYMVRDIVTVTGEDGSTERFIEVTNPWGPNGGSEYGTLRFTEQEYRDNFRTVYAGTMKDD